MVTPLVGGNHDSHQPWTLRAPIYQWRTDAKFRKLVNHYTQTECPFPAHEALAMQLNLREAPCVNLPVTNQRHPPKGTSGPAINPVNEHPAFPNSENDPVRKINQVTNLAWKLILLGV